MGKTMIAYDKEGMVVAKYYLTKKEKIEDIFNYMTVADYRKTEYIQELKWKNSEALEFVNTKKYYIKDMEK